MEETIVLYRSYEAALAARKTRADAAASCASAVPDGGVSGYEATTPDALLADVWELWGDGRAIVSGMQRRLTMATLLEEHPRFPATEASARSFARFASSHAGEPLFERIVAAEEGDWEELFGLDEAERAVFALVAAYRQRLTAAGLVDAGCAAALLEPGRVDGRIVIVERLDAIPAIAGFLRREGAEEVAEDGRRILADPAQRSSFAFPAGAGIAWQAVHRIVCEDMGDVSRIAVGSPDPQRLFAVLAPLLLRDGWEVGLQCAVSFERTAFGRAVVAAREIGAGGAVAARSATDIAYGPFSGMSSAEAQRLDTRLRADRSLDGEGVRASLREASPGFVALEALIEGDDEAIGRAAETLRAILEEARGLSAGARAAEARMLEAYRTLRENAVVCRASAAVVEEQARGLSVPLSLATSGFGSQRRCALFTDTGTLGRMGVGSFDGVVLEGLTDVAFSTASARSSLDVAAERLGLGAPPSRTEELRRDFEGARRAARRAFACVMPLRDCAFEPAYPAFVLDEYVGAYAALRGWSDAPRDEELFCFPCPLTESALRMGEDDLVAAVGACADPVVGVEELDGIVRGRLVDTRMIDLLKTVVEGDEVLPVLSPSAIEIYLLCPYRWFITRRLGIGEVDEGFSAREMGLFAHRAYAELYDRLAREGVKRLDEGVVDRARKLLDAVMDGIFAEYEATRGQVPESERLLAVTPWESVEVERLREALRDSLRLLAQLPGGYEVMAHEVVISPDDGVDFAGARLNGRIDRVDVAPQSGRFAILDYKGTLHGHAAGFSESDDPDAFELPSKVQALIYALGFQRLHDGLSAAAAVYATYRAKDEELLAGSFDPVGYDAAHLARKASAVQMGFGAFLELVEERIAPYVAALKDGRIAPEPRTADACSWCPYGACERRR